MKNIEEFIPFGSKNSVTRGQLCSLTGMSDRKVRREISLARRRTPILNLQDGNGYYRPREDDVLELSRFIKQEEHRAKMVFWSLKSARDTLKQLKNDGD